MEWYIQCQIQKPERVHVPLTCSSLFGSCSSATGTKKFCLRQQCSLHLGTSSCLKCYNPASERNLDLLRLLFLFFPPRPFPVVPAAALPFAFPTVACPLPFRFPPLPFPFVVPAVVVLAAAVLVAAAGLVVAVIRAEIALAPASPPAAPAAWLAAMATGRSFWFWRIWAWIPARVWAVSTAGQN